MAYKDMREWIAKLDSEGELKRITAEVDWRGELGALTRKVFGKNGPALLFENIKDYQSGRCTKLFVGGMCSPGRVALMMGMPKETRFKKVIEEMRHRVKKQIPPVVVPTGPVKENILRGKDVNLYDFPVPQWHPLDGGRYIDTWCAVITRDPEGGPQNAGLYRGMIADRDKIGVLLVPAQHWGIHYQRWQKLGKPMPVAVAYGWDEVMPEIAMAPLQNVDEFAVMGGMRGEAVEMVKCETSDLMVPASAEIVVEGFISPDVSTYISEGPFGEYPGYYGERLNRPFIQVECITHRNDPIFRGTLEAQRPQLAGVKGFMPNESTYADGAISSALSWNAIEDCGIPGVLDIMVRGTAYVRIRQTYRGQAKQVAAALWGSSAGQYLFKNVIVVDEDIDIHDFNSLDWAFTYRVNAKEDDIIVFPGLPGSCLDPSTRYEDRNELKYGTGKWNRVLIDATKNLEYPKVDEWLGESWPPLATEPKQEDVDLVERRWSEYGID